MYILQFTTFVSCTLCLYTKYVNSISYEARGQEFITRVKAEKATWTAKINPRFVGQDEFVMKKLCGIQPDFATKQFDKSKNDTKPIGKQKGRGGKGKKHGNHTKGWEEKIYKNPHHLIKRAALPQNYDWRDYTACESFDQIRDQKSCGNCWAVSSAAAMSDRFCLYTGKNKYFSAKHLTSCVNPGRGCDGWYTDAAADYYFKKGVATGNDPTVPEEPKACIAYPMTPMDNSMQCTTRCDDGRALDATKAGDWRIFNNEKAIMEEIYVYGSVVAIYEVFQDFGYFSSGIYQKSNKPGSSTGHHAVRLIGWGVENGVPFWQAANQWGDQWGDEGFFKILRGSNNCDIESHVVGVYPIEAWN